MLGEQGMDEALEQKPVLQLNPELAKLQKLEGCQPGQTFELKASAKVVEVSAKTGDDGLPMTMVTLELGGMTIEDPPHQVASVYPTMIG